MIFFNVWKRWTQIKQYYIYKEYVEIIYIYNYFIYIVKIYFTCSFFISSSFKLFLENIILSIVFFFLLIYVHFLVTSVLQYVLQEGVSS